MRQFTTPRGMNTRTTSYFDDDYVHDNRKTAPLTAVIMFFLLLGPLFKVVLRYFGVVKSDSQLSTGFKLKIL